MGCVSQKSDWFPISARTVGLLRTALRPPKSAILRECICATRQAANTGPRMARKWWDRSHCSRRCGCAVMRRYMENENAVSNSIAALGLFTTIGVGSFADILDAFSLIARILPADPIAEPNPAFRRLIYRTRACAGTGS